MSNLSQVYIWKLTSIGITVLFLGAIFFALLPNVVHVYEKQKVLSSQNEQIEFMGDWKNQLEDIESKHQILDERLGNIVVELAKEGEFSAIVEQLFDKANTTSISIERIKPTSEQLDNEYNSKEVSLDIAGSYHGIARFINQIEQNGLMIEVQSFEIMKSEETQNLLNGTINITITMLRG